MSDIAFKARITGLVQGVWFRGWTCEQAERLGLSGWVRNEADGSVCALVSGSEPKVREMLRLFGQGPRLARVDSVVEEPAEPPDHRDFRVLY